MAFIPIKHRICGGVAFLYRPPVVAGEPIEAERARLIDGSIPVTSTVMVCGTCGEVIYDQATDLVPFDGESR